MLSEFELIARYFNRPGSGPGQVALGIGDDCALLVPQPGMQLAISSDMLVEGRHFFPDVDPCSLGHKALAVNLSDLAAMGARPLGFTLALSLPAVDEAWLAGFAGGMFALADAHACPLVGGDTTRGPLNICITVFGEVPPGQALRRSGARAGDDIWVSGSLGDARLALAALLGELTLAPQELKTARSRLEMPSPRLALGQALRGIAHAAIDVSDGLCGDLGHILEQSGAGATVEADALPAGIVLSCQPAARRRAFTLAGGDDYELCFTAPQAARQAVQQASAATATPVTRIGRIDADSGLRFIDADGQPVGLQPQSFDHFRS